MTLNTRGMFGTFYLNEVEFALPIDQIQEVVNYPEKITPMPLNNNFLLGIFNLRGTVIPIISLKKLLNFKDEEDVDLTEHKVAIINFNGSRIGYVFDSTSEILRVSDSELDYVNFENKASNDVVKGIIHLDQGKRIIQIIDPAKMLNLENIPGIVQAQNTYEHISKRRQLKKAISFTVSKMNFCFDILSVREILKYEKADDSYFKSDISLGIINLRGQCIPIVDYVKLIDPSALTSITEDSRVIIVKAENIHVGLLVDAIANIFSYDADEVNNVPLVEKSKRSMIKGAVAYPELGDLFLVDEEKIFTQDEMQEITKGHKNLYKSIEEKNIKKSVRKASYITFRVQQMFGVPIGEVREIINVPDDIAMAPGVSGAIEGVFNLRGKLVTVINTRKIYKLEEAQRQTQNKILIFEIKNELMGLVVDSVESIENINEESKIPVPSLLTKKIHQMYGNDIKEIVSYKEINKDEQEKTMVVLDIKVLLQRLTKEVMAA